MPVIRNLPLLLGLALLGACASHHEEQPLTTEVSRSAAYAPGVPGGVVTAVEELRAKVVALDRSKRSFTLEDEQGNRHTVVAPPEMVNYPQLQVGDKVRARVKVEGTMYLREPGAAVHSATAVAMTPPKGSKPGLLVIGTQELTAVVKAIDSVQHTATLQFADGSSNTYKVRPDVQIKKEYLNREVVIRLDSEVAVSVEAQ